MFDGATAIHSETYLSSMELGPPDFPEVGKEAIVNIDGVQHKTKIDQKIYTYFFAGDASLTPINGNMERVWQP